MKRAWKQPRGAGHALHAQPGDAASGPYQPKPSRRASQGAQLLAAMGVLARVVEIDTWPSASSNWSRESINRASLEKPIEVLDQPQQAGHKSPVILVQFLDPADVKGQATDRVLTPPEPLPPRAVVQVRLGED